MKEKKIENCLMDIFSELDEVEGIDNFGTEINDIESFEIEGFTLIEMDPSSFNGCAQAH